MAHFFMPAAQQSDSAAAAGSHAEQASDALDIEEVLIDAAGIARFGLWGGGPSGEKLVIKVYRAGVVVNEGQRPAVKVASAGGFTARHISLYTATGLKDGDEIYGMLDDKRRYTGVLTARKPSNDDRTLIKRWADAVKAGQKFGHPKLCDFAVPYLAVDPKQKVTPLDDRNIGGPLNKVRGLAMHTAGAGNGTRSPFQMVEYGMVGTWNKNVEKFRASSHFGIAGDGTLVQFIPTSLKAWTQGDPGDHYWVSVEVDNGGTAPMYDAQLRMSKRLFAWVRRQHHVEPKLATGLITKNPAYKQHAEITADICAKAGAATTDDSFTCAMSEGLSCHNWLKQIKPCPGVGILGQMGEIVTGSKGF